MKSEKITRKEIIDEGLERAGWNLADRTQVILEYAVEGSGYCDYVLLGKDGNPLAVVEAKKTTVDAETGREQAKQYCRNIHLTKGAELPFCFYTNGNDIFFWDLDNYPPKKVQGFPSREDLERYSYLRRARKSLSGELINPGIAGRDFQIRAIRAVMESIEKRRSKFLLVMATGTGKTRTCIGLVDALMRGGWVEKVLFLVDRVALQNQTLEAFKEYLSNEPRWPMPYEREIAIDRRIYVATYPTILNIIRDDKNPLSPHFFDLVVVDESHRSIYNIYQELLNYFNTIMLGLTATPTNAIDRNTFQLFDCEDGIPTFAYSYEEAVNHVPPYLCDFQVLVLKTRFQMEGINKRTISLEDQRKLTLEGKDIQEIDFEGTEIERSIVSQGTNALIVRTFMEESIKDDDGVLPAKTIFFCVSRAHARRMEEIFDSLFPEYKGELAKVIVSEDPRVHGKGGLLDQFVNNNMPRVAISVDMLDTGIDVREISNLVFAKPVYSYTKFWQMIGRGSRLLEPEKIKPWCTKKDLFLILDCWDNFEYFKLNPKGKELKQQIPLPVRLFGLRLDKIEKALEKGELKIVTKEVFKLENQIALLPRNSVLIMNAEKDLERLEEDGFFEQLTHDKIEFVRNSIKPLFRVVSTVDFKAMRFEKDIVEVSLAHLIEDKNKFRILMESIVEEINELPLNINIVAKEEKLIRNAQTARYWEEISEEKFDELTERLAPLMRFNDSLGPIPTAKFNFKDHVYNKEFVEFGPQHEAVPIVRYKELVEEKIRTLVLGNPLLQKIKRGFSLTMEEVESLADTLYNEHPHITVDLLRKIYNHRKAELNQFIKHIFGIETLESFPESVSKSFGEFIAGHSYLGSRQLDFLYLLQSFLLEKGDVERRDLINAPFTMIHPDGILGVFSPNEIEEIISIIHKLAA